MMGSLNQFMKKGIRVFTSKDLKSSKHCLLEKNKANLMLGIINRGVSYKSADVTSKPYRAYILDLI